MCRAPIDVPDRREVEEPLLYGPDGRTPVLVRRPRPVGFQPPRTPGWQEAEPEGPASVGGDSTVPRSVATATAYTPDTTSEPAA